MQFIAKNLQIGQSFTCVHQRSMQHFYDFFRNADSVCVPAVVRAESGYQVHNIICNDGKANSVFISEVLYPSQEELVTAFIRCVSFN